MRASHTPKNTPTLTKTPVSVQLDKSITSCESDGIPIPKPDNFGFEGVIVYQAGDHSGMHSVGGEPLVYSNLPVSQTKEYSVMGFSLDGHWLAYSPDRENFEDVFRNPKIILLGADGEIIEHNMDISTYIPYIQQLPEEARLIGWGGSWINNELLNMGIAYQFAGGETWIGSFAGIIRSFPRYMAG